MRRSINLGCLMVTIALMTGCPNLAGPTPKASKTPKPSPSSTTAAVASIDVIGQASPTPGFLDSGSLSPSPATSPTASTSPGPQQSGSPKPSTSPTASTSPSPGASPTQAVTYEVTTLTGGANSGNADGNKDTARFNGPNGIDIDADGNLYVADAGNHRIRKITPAGDVTTIAGDTSGNANGPALSAGFKSPYGLAVAPNGDLYVADTGNNAIRKLSGGVVTTVAGGPTKGLVDEVGEAAQFNQPFSLALDGSGNLYVADAGNHAIRKIDLSDPARPVVSTLAGGSLGARDGALADARFNTPNDLAFGPDGNLYVADFGNNSIRAIDLIKKEVRTLAGGSLAGFRNGNGRTAAFNAPTGLAVGKDGAIYVADNQNHRIRRVTPDGEATSLAGQRPGFADGKGDAAEFYEPTDVAVGKDGKLYVADTRNQRIRVLSVLP
jgi:sugar lactone lactonase YvrE